MGATLAATVIIPARFGSTRFPAKILASETGRPLVQHVVDRVRLCKRVSRILVATDDSRIVDALTPFGTECVMTSPVHPSGTDRIAEVARGLADDLASNILINVQGDEPEIEPEVIDSLAEHMLRSTDEMATAATPFPPGAEVANPNLVKVVLAESGHAIYFSRSPIPFHRDAGSQPPEYLLHLGIYAYRRDFLLRYASWTPTALEQAEKLEQLRALEHGVRLFVMKVARATHGIDTPDQYQHFVQRYKHKSNPLETSGMTA
jgi:3-deoxy-manno-octulosonate cytidylyltransferase (CMP-KDO synthetase)